MFLKELNKITLTKLIIMNQFKRAQVIVLPTNKKEYKANQIILHTYGDKLGTLRLAPWTDIKGELSTIFQGQHLYIISDDEIKEGDYHITSDHEGYGDKKYKIIATTDTSLKIESELNAYYRNGIGGANSLPQPSQQFIERFIESYNKGEVITDVLVEYEPFVMTSGYSILKNDEIKNKNNWIYELKVNPKDNTITIKKLKDSWNREELKILFKKHEKDVIKYINSLGPSATPSFNDKWIEENL